MNQISGIYTRAQGARREYTYTLQFDPTADGCAWRATVRCAGEVKGVPTGQILGNVDPVVAAEGMVRGAMEDLIGIRE